MTIKSEHTNQISRSLAYRAMFRFLERHYERTGAGELGALLGDMALLSDGGSVDPSALIEWQECIQEVIEDDLDISLRLDRD